MSVLPISMDDAITIGINILKVLILVGVGYVYGYLRGLKSRDSRIEE